MSLSLNATHIDTSHGRNLSEYDVHSLFGHMQGKRVKEFLDSDKSVNPGKRQLILSRSTYTASA
jgi:hypothetical protein